PSGAPPARSPSPGDSHSACGPEACFAIRSFCSPPLSSSSASTPEHHRQAIGYRLGNGHSSPLLLCPHATCVPALPAWMPAQSPTLRVAFPLRLEHGVQQVLVLENAVRLPHPWLPQFCHFFGEESFQQARLCMSQATDVVKAH